MAYVRGISRLLSVDKSNGVFPHEFRGGLQDQLSGGRLCLCPSFSARLAGILRRVPSVFIHRNAVSPYRSDSAAGCRPRSYNRRYLWGNLSGRDSSIAGAQRLEQSHGDSVVFRPHQCCDPQSRGECGICEIRVGMKEHKLANIRLVDSFGPRRALHPQPGRWQ